MTPQDWAVEMALYSKWQNETLFGLCDGLSAAQRDQDLGLFFGSIHATLDHILMVDKVLIGFAEHGPPLRAPFEPGTIQITDYDALKTERAAFDEDLVAFFRAKPADWLSETLTFFHPAVGRERTMPRQFWCMQMFNHATHHRAQATTGLHRLGVDYGITDMPYNPYSQY